MKRVNANDFGSALGPLFREADEMESGPFANSKVEPDHKERLVAEMIWVHRGRNNPISIAMLTKATGWNERDIKGIVEQLVVTHRVRIGGRRGDPVGYFVIVDLEDLEMAVRPYRDQIFAMWRRLRVLLEPHTLRELHGQLALKETGDGPKTAD